MKIIFANIPLHKQKNAFVYVNCTNKKVGDKEVIFPVNAILQYEIRPNEKVKVIMLTKEDIDGNGKKNTSWFENELNEINKDIGANIEYKIISAPFIETQDVHEKMFRNILDEFSDGCEIYADITFGPKSLPIILFAAMNFAEKYFNAVIRTIAYGKVDLVDSGTATKPINPVLYDMTSLYYLNSITNSMDFANSESALKALDKLMDLKNEK